MNSKLRLAGMAIATVAFAFSIFLLLAPYVAPGFAVPAELSGWVSPAILAVGLVGILLFNLGNRQNKSF
jgi:hypothetical protein